MSNKGLGNHSRRPVWVVAIVLFRGLFRTPVYEQIEAVPKRPRTALTAASATERFSKSVQTKSARAQIENTSKTPLLPKLRLRCWLVGFISRRLCAKGQMARTGDYTGIPPAYFMRYNGYYDSPFCHFHQFLRWGEDMVK